MDHAHSIPQSHADDKQCLEMEAMEEEGRDHLSFVATCGVALQVCPPEAHGVLMYPLQLFMGNMSLTTLLAIHPPVSTTREESTLVICNPSTPAAPTPSLGTKQWHPLPDKVASSP